MTEVLLIVTILVDKNIVKHFLWEGKLENIWADAFNLESLIWWKSVDILDQLGRLCRQEKFSTSANVPLGLRCNNVLRCTVKGMVYGLFQVFRSWERNEEKWGGRKQQFYPGLQLIFVQEFLLKSHYIIYLRRRLTSIEPSFISEGNLCAFGNCLRLNANNSQ